MQSGFTKSPSSNSGNGFSFNQKSSLDTSSGFGSRSNSYVQNSQMANGSGQRWDGTDGSPNSTYGMNSGEGCPALEAIRAQCAKSRSLFEDPQFPAEMKSIFVNSTPRSVPVTWFRAPEIARRHRFSPAFNTSAVVPGQHLNMVRGPLGDRWVFAALAVISEYPDLLRAIVPEGQGFADQYCGAFSFRFWRMGLWREVVVDDRLPVDSSGELLCLQAGDDFMAALLEKAYAKFCGSYEALKSLSIADVLAELTGGMMELFELKSLSNNADVAAELNNVLFKAFERQSLVGAATASQYPRAEGELPSGLLSCHTYSVTDIKEIRLIQQVERGAPGGDQQSVTLLRVRNQMGRASWRGDWSEGSAQWVALLPPDREAMGLVLDDEAEFWIDLRDLLAQFELLFLCHLPSVPAPQSQPPASPLWNAFELPGAWIRHVSAGGSRKFLETHWQNPQFRLALHEPDVDESSQERAQVCSFLVELLQGTGRELLPHAPPSLDHIGFTVYKLEPGVELPAPRRWLEGRQPVQAASTAHFVNSRSVVRRVSLPLGDYLLVPSTFAPNTGATPNSSTCTSFVLRCFFEQPNELQAVEQAIELPDSISRLLPERDSELSTAIQDRLLKSFYQLSGPDMYLDSSQLAQLLNREYFSLDTTAVATKDAFTYRTAQALLLLVDKEKRLSINYHQFRLLWNCLRYWKRAFDTVGSDRRGRISSGDTRAALVSLGVRLNERLFSLLLHKCLEPAPELSSGGGAGKRGSTVALDAEPLSVRLDLFVRLVATLFASLSSFFSLSTERKLSMNPIEYLEFALALP